MAQRPRQLTLRYSLLVKPRLAEIWQWNAAKYGEAHATEYVEFLRKPTRSLCSDYLRGRVVPNRASYRYMTLKKRARGHGYVVVYQVLETEVHVLYYFHTAQDWMRQLQAMLPEC
ncbi:MAG: type II toxin-antitoxin system RelE/ParE family toxin [Tepidisphaeraceae bacterium]|jgi:plasmid stabilization system protein ParE